MTPVCATPPGIDAAFSRVRYRMLIALASSPRQQRRVFNRLIRVVAISSPRQALGRCRRLYSQPCPPLNATGAWQHAPASTGAVSASLMLPA